MKKMIVLTLAMLFSLSACVPTFLKSDSQDTPAAPVDIAATVDAAASTQVAQTFEALAALATPTMEVPTAEPSTDEATATAIETTELPSETPTLEEPQTPEGTLPAETETSDETLVPTATATLEATATSIYPSPTSPISIQLPPDYIPRYEISIINKTKGKIYISLQGVTVDDYHPIIEYDLKAGGQTTIAIPEGTYTAIVYVGKEPMVDYFSIHGSNEITIFIERDELRIKK